jgi:hypothetical protein
VGFKKKDMVQVDQETGEILPGVTILIPDKNKLRDPFMLAAREGFIRLAKDKDLTGEDRRVLDVYLASMDFENWIHISQQDIADLLEMPKQNVSRSTKRLVEKTILIEGPKVGRSKTFRLNAFYGWKGRINKEYYDTYEKHTTLMKAVD